MVNTSVDKKHFPLLSVRGLTKLFPIHPGVFRKPSDYVHAVDNISFELEPGERLGLVGESGCGKTTVARLLAKLTTASHGSVRFQLDGGRFLDITGHTNQEHKAFRRQTQMIFQDPYGAINPRRNLYETVAEPLAVQRIGSRSDRLDMVTQILELVGLAPSNAMLAQYPHELSGGQLQRVAIARALVIEPSFVVADEPTSMLDVSVRSGIMNLMLELAERSDTAYLFITHDLAVARYMCQRIAVMYLGKIVEVAETEELLQNPLHPYSKALRSAVPVADPDVRRDPVNIEGDVSRPVGPLSRCCFYDRCPIAAEVCRINPHPPLDDHGGHLVACYLA